MGFDFEIVAGAPEAHACDLLAIAVHEGAAALDKEHGKPARLADERLQALDRALAGIVAQAIGEEEFTGKEAQLLLLHTHGKVGPQRLALLGLGKKKDADRDREQLRAFAARAVRNAKNAGARAFALSWPAPADAEALERDAQALAEGALFGSYRFDKYLKDKKPLRLAKAQILLASADGLERAQAGVRLGERIGAAVAAARSLVNEPALSMTPAALAKAAEEAAARAGLTIEVKGRAAIEELKMRLFLAVAQGSAAEPLLVKLSYLPKGAPNGPPLALVGKAITFDSGGLSLKTAAGMEEMKTDMAGAAAVIAAMEVVAALAPPFAVHGWFGACENMPSGTAIRPGDVVVGRSGTSVEILNTDAEGRLVLADVLALACEDKPAAVVDLATLTAAAIIALGPLLAGLFCNDEPLAAELTTAARAAGEELWRLPLPPQNEEFIKSPIADLKNTGGRWGGAIHAALFLQHFVGKTPWAHLDIAGPSTSERERGVNPRGATGFGVRTLVELVRRRVENK